jgi:hypothetical protein
MVPHHPATAIHYIESIPIPDPPPDQVGDILRRPALGLAPTVARPAIPPIHVARRMELVLLPVRPIKIDAIALPQLLHPQQSVPISPQLIYDINVWSLLNHWVYLFYLVVRPYR